MLLILVDVVLIIVSSSIACKSPANNKADVVSILNMVDLEIGVGLVTGVDGEAADGGRGEEQVPPPGPALQGRGVRQGRVKPPQV